MSRLKISSEAGSHRAEVELDGQPLKSCTTLDLRMSVDVPFSANIGVLVTDAMDVELDASVILTVTMFDEFDIEETPLSNGGRRLRAVPR